MNDRELLEKAAKAAGFCIVWSEMHRVGDTDVDCTDLAYVISNDPEESPAYWNPLTDDGDALRLAVKLALDVSQWTITDHFTTVSGAGARAKELHDSDPYAATRRAIVRAAAAIGEKQ